VLNSLGPLGGVRLGPPGQEYATVWGWRVPGTSLSVRLHHWYGSDDQRAYHSHPQWFCTLVLWGGYVDHFQLDPDTAGLYGSDHDWEVLRWLSFRRRGADYRHYVVPRTRHVWTLLLFGGPRQRWDFWDKQTGRRYKRDKWFAERGHHTQDGSPPVRLRPDGSVIDS